MEIRATAWNDALQLATGDISRGGLFIRCDEPLSPGDQLTVSLDLPDGSRLEVGGEVAHCISPERAAAEQIAAGFGVRFDEKHAIDLDLLGAIAASNSAGEGRIDTSYVSLPALLLDRQGGRQVITSAHHLVDRDAGPADDGIDIVVDGMLDEAELGASAARPHARGADAATADPDELIFGLDFGTSYSSIALVRGNAVQVFCGDDGHNQIPSTVAYLDSGPPLVGWAAREQLALSPATTIPAPKRLVGRQYDDPKVDPFLGATPVRFQRGPGGMIVAELFGEIVAIPQILRLPLPPPAAARPRGRRAAGPARGPLRAGGPAAGARLDPARRGARRDRGAPDPRRAGGRGAGLWPRFDRRSNHRRL